MNARITMADVAKRARVHVTTVSMSLRNHPSIPIETRERIQQLAAQMGYQRDPSLSALIAYRNRTRPIQKKSILAYVTHWDSRWGWKNQPAHLAFYNGAAEKAAGLGFQLEHFWLGEPDLTHRRMSGILYSRGITGLIIASHTQEADAALDFDWAQFSAVKIDFCPREQQLHFVTNDQRAVIALAMQRAMAAGYRRIGFVLPHWWDEAVELAWSAGFLALQQKLPPETRIPILFYDMAPESESGASSGADTVVPQRAFAEWFRLHRPEVIIGYGSLLLPRLETLRLAIPQDVAYVDIFLEKPNGLIAGVRQNCHRVGEVAVELLVGQLHQHVFGLPSIPIATFVEGTWHEGASLPPAPPLQVHGKLPPEFTTPDNRGQQPQASEHSAQTIFI